MKRKSEIRNPRAPQKSEIFVGGSKSEISASDIAALAAAAVTANPKLTIDEAVRQATDALRRASVQQLTPRQVADSVRPDKIMCFEDGTWHIMLRRYIKRKWGMTPETYREKWGLADNYPMTAPAYSAARTKIAKKTGLGRK